MTRKNESSTLLLLRRTCARLVSTELWVVGGMVTSSIIYPRLLPAAVFTAAFFWPLRWLANGRWSARTPCDFAIALLLLMTAVSGLITPLPQITHPQIYRLLSGIALFYTIINSCQTPQKSHLLLWIFNLGGLAVALLAPFSVDWPLGKLPLIPTGFYQRFSILVADSVHPNVIAGILVLLLPVTLAGLLFGWQEMKAFERAFGLLSAASMSGVVLLSLSRGAWMAFLLAGLTLVVLRWRWGWIAVVLALVATVAGFYWLGVQQVVDFLIASNTVGSIDGRLEVWSRSINIIQDFPFTGIGMGVFQPIADRLYPFMIFSPGKIFHAHNLFLQVAVDLGLPGLLAWLWILAIVVIHSSRAYRGGRRLNTPLIAALGAGLLCSQIALIVHGLTDAVTWGMVRPAPVIWALWGAAIVAAFQVNKMQAEIITE